MKSIGCFTLVFAMLFSTASIEAVTIDTVPVGNAGNPADTRYINSEHPNGVGAVGYDYRIGETEVTNAQYVDFLNAVAATDTYGLYSTNMGSDTQGGIIRTGSSGSYAYTVKSPALGQGFGGSDYTYGNKPVVWVSWGDAARFANWLQNGQLTGPQDDSTTEDGAYTLNGAVTNAALNAVPRNPDARWWIPSEDEWYKAAYHKNDGGTGNYWNYPTGPIGPNNNFPSTDTGNSANYSQCTEFSCDYTTGNASYPMTDAGAYTLSDSPYGTFDQAGNVWEWNETLFFDGDGRGFRGGSWSSDSSPMHASYSDLIAATPVVQLGDIGFRLAHIPEPSAMWLASFAGLTILLRCRKMSRHA